MVIRGSLSKLSVAKIRRYLKRYGVPPNHLLMFHDQLLTDNMVGEDFGLVNNSILHLHDPAEVPHEQNAVWQSNLHNETNVCDINTNVTDKDVTSNSNNNCGNKINYSSTNIDYQFREGMSDVKRY